MKHEMCVMNADGDTKVFWDAANPESVAIAAETFNSYRGRGYAAFAMSSGTSGDQMGSFDPNVGSILFVPPLQGG